MPGDARAVARIIEFKWAKKIHSGREINRDELRQLEWQEAQLTIQATPLEDHSGKTE